MLKNVISLAVIGPWRTEQTDLMMAQDEKYRDHQSNYILSREALILLLLVDVKNLWPLMKRKHEYKAEV